MTTKKREREKEMLRFHIVESKKFDQKAVGDKFYRTNIYGEAIYIYNSNICGGRGIVPSLIYESHAIIINLSKLYASLFLIGHNNTNPYL